MKRILLTLPLLLLFSAQASAVSGYSLYRTLTVNADAFISADLTNKTVTACFTNASHGSLFSSTQADGDDIRFATDAAPTVELDHDIIQWVHRR